VNEKDDDLVVRLHREAVEGERQRSEQERALIEQGLASPPPPCGPRTIPYTELPDGKPDSPINQEWNFYRREVGRLLAEGQEGRWLLIKGEYIVGIWDTREEASAVARQRYLMQPCLIHQIRSREPLLRLSARFYLCPG
jgi:hypothetical protein